MRHVSIVSRSVALRSNLFGAMATVGVVSLAASARGASTVEPEIAYGQGTIETGRSTALSGADRALSNSLTSLFINPANMATSQVYHVGALVSIWPEANRQTYGVAAIDSIGSSTHLAGGLGATYNRQDPDGVDRVWTDVRFALAYPFSEQFFMGAGGRYLWVEQNGLGPLGYSVASGGLPNGKIVRGIGLDAGLTFRPIPELSLSLVGNNINDPGNTFQPSSVAGGVGYGAEIFTLEADGEADFTTWGVTRYNGMAGAGLLLGDLYPIRAGYRFDQGPRTHSVSIGAGYIDRSFGIQLGARRIVSGEEATVITLDIRYHVESTGLASGPGDSF